MCTQARLYNCPRCHKQVIICRHCDSGQIYCGPDCARPARQQSLRDASSRYQQSKKGQHNHAARQRTYRQRKAQDGKKVTHHTSPQASLHDVLSPGQIQTKQAGSDLNNQRLHCHFCQKPISGFMRQGFLRPDDRLQTISILKAI